MIGSNEEVRKIRIDVETNAEEAERELKNISKKTKGELNSLERLKKASIRRGMSAESDFTKAIIAEQKKRANAEAKSINKQSRKFRKLRPGQYATEGYSGRRVHVKGAGATNGKINPNTSMFRTRQMTPAMSKAEDMHEKRVSNSWNRILKEREAIISKGMKKSKAYLREQVEGKQHGVYSADELVKNRAINYRNFWTGVMNDKETSSFNKLKNKLKGKFIKRKPSGKITKVESHGMQSVGGEDIILAKKFAERESEYSDFWNDALAKQQTAKEKASGSRKGRRGKKRKVIETKPPVVDVPDKSVLSPEDKSNRYVSKPKTTETRRPKAVKGPTPRLSRYSAERYRGSDTPASRQVVPYVAPEQKEEIPKSRNKYSRADGQANAIKYLNSRKSVIKKYSILNGIDNWYFKEYDKETDKAKDNAKLFGGFKFKGRWRYRDKEAGAMSYLSRFRMHKTKFSTINPDPTGGEFAPRTPSDAASYLERKGSKSKIRNWTGDSRDRDFASKDYLFGKKRSKIGSWTKDSFERFSPKLAQIIYRGTKTAVEKEIATDKKKTENKAVTPKAVATPEPSSRAVAIPNIAEPKSKAVAIPNIAEPKSKAVATTSAVESKSTESAKPKKASEEKPKEKSTSKPSMPKAPRATKSTVFRDGGNRIGSGLSSIRNNTGSIFQAVSQTVGELTMFAGAIMMVGMMAGRAVSAVTALGTAFADAEKKFLTTSAFRNSMFNKQGDAGIRGFDEANKVNMKYTGLDSFSSGQMMARIGDQLRQSGAEVNGDKLSNIATILAGAGALTGKSSEESIDAVMKVVTEGGKADKIGMAEFKATKNIDSNIEELVKLYKDNPISRAILARGTVESAMTKVKSSPMELLGKVYEKSQFQVSDAFGRMGDNFMNAAGRPEVVEAWRRALSNFTDMMDDVFTEDKIAKSLEGASVWVAMLAEGSRALINTAQWFLSNGPQVIKTLKDIVDLFIMFAKVKIGVAIFGVLGGIFKLVTGLGMLGSALTGTVGILASLGGMGAVGSAVGGGALLGGALAGGGALLTAGLPLALGALAVGGVGYMGYKGYKAYKNAKSIGLNSSLPEPPSKPINDILPEPNQEKFLSGANYKYPEGFNSKTKNPFQTTINVTGNVVMGQEVVQQEYLVSSFNAY